MKKIILVLFVLSVLFIPACYTTQNVSQANHPRQTFSQLDEYGQWIDVPGLGTIWKPDVSPQWQPYSDGHWVWTENGWMWDSYEPYGWVVYHYGYWDNDPQYGWIWRPSYDWTPARVVWYNQNGYVGWAPRPSPEYPVSNVYISQTNYWVVVPQKNFVNDDVVKYRTRDNNTGIRNIRNNEGGRAPDVREIESVTNQRIAVTNVVNERVNGGNRQIIRARIQTDRNNTNGQNRNSGVQENNNVTRPVVTPPVRRENPPVINPPQRDNRIENSRVNIEQRNTVDTNKKDVGNSVKKNGRQNIKQREKATVKSRSNVKKKKTVKKNASRKDSSETAKENIRR